MSHNDKKFQPHFVIKASEELKEYNKNNNIIYELINDGGDSFLNKARKDLIRKKPEYGEQAFRDIYAVNINNVLSCISDNVTKRSILMFGEVQSGKTNNMIFLLCALRDMGYKKFVILNGTKNSLNNQSYGRLSEYHKDAKFLDFSSYFFSDSNDTEFLYGIKQNINNLLKNIKSYSNSFLKQMNLIILDDESDEASAEKGKSSIGQINADLSEIFMQKDEMKFKSVTYIPISATPYANILFDSDLLRPEFVIPLTASSTYCGIEKFNKNNSYHVIPEKIIYGFDNPSYKNPDLIWYIADIISEFVVRCIKDNRNYQFLINHSTSKSDICNLDKLVRVAIDKLLLLKEDSKIKMLESNQLSREQFDNMLRKIRDEGVLIKMDKVNSENKNDCPEIIIGGNLLSRGVTFDNLLFEIMTNNPEGSFNSDTLLQRARWFGYREKYIDKMKIFVSERGKRFYNNIGFVQNEIREIYKKSSKNNNDVIEEIKGIFKKYSDKWGV